MYRDLERAKAAGGIHDGDSYSTPLWIVEPARKSEPKGKFDLDCCTNELAKALGIVDATVGWTINDDCLAQETWDVCGDGTTILWGQPPYSKPDKIIERFIKEWRARHIQRAYWLVKNDPSTDWWEQLRDNAAFLVLPRRRVHHVIGQDEDGDPVLETNSNFCSAMWVFVDERSDVCQLYRDLRDEYDGLCDVYPTLRSMELAAEAP